MAYSPANSGKYIPSSYSAYPDATEGLPVCGTSSVGLGQQGLDKLKTTLDRPKTLEELNPVYAAYEVLKDIAKRAVERPHNLPEAEIQIIGAFVLGFNSK